MLPGDKEYTEAVLSNWIFKLADHLIYGNPSVKIATKYDPEYSNYEGIGEMMFPNQTIRIYMKGETSPFMANHIPYRMEIVGIASLTRQAHGPHIVVEVKRAVPPEIENPVLRLLMREFLLVSHFGVRDVFVSETPGNAYEEGVISRFHYPSVVYSSGQLMFTESSVVRSSAPPDISEYTRTIEKNPELSGRDRMKVFSATPMGKGVRTPTKRMDVSSPWASSCALIAMKVLVGHSDSCFDVQDALMAWALVRGFYTVKGDHIARAYTAYLKDPNRTPNVLDKEAFNGDMVDLLEKSGISFRDLMTMLSLVGYHPVDLAYEHPRGNVYEWGPILKRAMTTTNPMLYHVQYPDGIGHVFVGFQNVCHDQVTNIPTMDKYVEFAQKNGIVLGGYTELHHTPVYVENQLQVTANPLSEDEWTRYYLDRILANIRDNDPLKPQIDEGDGTPIKKRARPLSPPNAPSKQNPFKKIR